MKAQLEPMVLRSVAGAAGPGSAEAAAAPLSSTHLEEPLSYRGVDR